MLKPRAPARTQVQAETLFGKLLQKYPFVRLSADQRLEIIQALKDRRDGDGKRIFFGGGK
jgi:hypothetical protein